jgi:hypothetical protein
MPVRFAAAFDAIEVFIRGILPRAEVTRAGNEQLHVRNDAQSITLTFNRSQLDDFGVVLRGNQSVRYSNGIRGDFYLPVYVALGIELKRFPKSVLSCLPEIDRTDSRE